MLSGVGLSVALNIEVVSQASDVTKQIIRLDETDSSTKRPIQQRRAPNRNKLVEKAFTNISSRQVRTHIDTFVYFRGQNIPTRERYF